MRRHVLWWIVYTVIIAGAIIVVVAMTATHSYVAVGSAAAGFVVLGATWGAVAAEYPKEPEPAPETTKSKWRYEAYASESGRWNYEVDVYCGDTRIDGSYFDYWFLRGWLARKIRFEEWRRVRKTTRTDTRPF